MGDKLDLDRMQKLLNQLDSNEPSADIVKSKNNTFQIDNKTYNSNCFDGEKDGINIDQADMCRLLSHKGGIKGYSSRAKARNLINDIIINTGMDNIKNCKSLIIEYKINPNVNLFGLGDTMEDLSNLTSDQCEVVFGTQTADTIPKDLIEYKILLSGIDDQYAKADKIDNNELEIKYKKVLEENKLLRDQKERMELTVMSLKPR
ncbi:MAG: hypothetical protein U9Q04_04520 [Campylobacterota bacterium]|nr:hypothetical protein [Campylobacterota bacterium]